MWREEQTNVGQPAPGNLHYVLDALGTHKELRKTKDETEE